MSDLRFQPLGPNGVQQRMAEIRARMGTISNRNVAQFAPPESTPAAQANLMGAIGSDAGLRPMNPMGEGIALNPAPTPANLKPMIEEAALNHNVDPALLDALVSVESGYDSNAVSNKRAAGLTQLMPDTARALGVKNPFDPMQNLNGGAKYLSQLLGQFNDVKLAVAAYNAGPGAVTRHGGIPNYAETKSYVDKVFNLYEAKKAK